MTFLNANSLHATLILGLASAPAWAAPSANKFDGSWAVVATTDAGSCQGPFRYPIVIRDGNVNEANGEAADASGRAGPDGRISGTIRNGLANVSVAGRLRGSSGSGRWTLTGLGDCSGRWTASRNG